MRRFLYRSHSGSASNSDSLLQALVSAKLHEEDYPSIIRSVAGVAFLGTPHRGSNSQSKASVIASIASSVALGEHSNLLKVLAKDSEILADLLHDFTRTVTTIGIPLFCFFEQHKSDIAKVLKFKGSKMLMPGVKVRQDLPNGFMLKQSDRMLSSMNTLAVLMVIPSLVLQVNISG